MPKEVIDVSGTLWNGQAILEGGYELKWTVKPLRSLVQLSLAVDWILSGVDTALGGAAALWPNSATLSGVDGRAGWGLVRLAMPGLPVSCEGSAALSLSRVFVSRDRQGAVGELRSGPAVCVNVADAPPRPVEVPPLSAVASMQGDAATVIIAASADPGKALAEVSIGNRVLAITIHPEGARLAQAMPASGPIMLEYPF